MVTFSVTNLFKASSVLAVTCGEREKKPSFTFFDKLCLCSDTAEEPEPVRENAQCI